VGSVEGDIGIIKDKITELQKYNEEQRSYFLDFNKKLSNSRVLDSEGNDLSSSLLMNSGQLPKRGQEGAAARGSPSKQGDKGKTVYQFDTENYLMDGDGNYILTEDGKPIKLTE
jgi:hypothetical protein